MAQVGKKRGVPIATPAAPAAQPAKPKAKAKVVKAIDVFAEPGNSHASGGGFPTVDAEVYMDDEEEEDTRDVDKQLQKQVAEKAAQKKKRSGGFQSMGMIVIIFCH
jgi:hypothetical protein